MMLSVKDVFEYLAGFAPVEMAMGFDNVGLLVGRSDREVGKILVALDITDEVIQEAISLRADLIVSHHPLFFELKGLTDREWTQARALTLAENRIAAICMHTNLDAAEGGVNDALMNVIGIKVDGVLDAETAIGRVGMLPAEMTMAAFLSHVKYVLKANGLRYHDAGKPVCHVAVCGGSGGSDIPLAAAHGCDTYVTADIKYDQFLEAKHLGLNLVDADHFCTENVVVPVLEEKLKKEFPDVEIFVSKVHCQTAQFY